MNKYSNSEEPDLLKVSEVKLIYRNKVKAIDRPQISSSKQAYDIIYKYWDEDIISLKEEFKMLMLDRRNRCMGITKISEGGCAGTYVDAKIVFPIALKARTHNIIFTHNHPSGEPKPSSADIKLTNKFQKAAYLLDIKILDHIIVTPEKEHYFSFMDEGLIQEIRGLDL